MKKGILALALAGVSLVLFSSCTTTKVHLVFDDSIPIEQSAQVQFYNIGYITGINGIAVDWDLRFNGLNFNNVDLVMIPAGKTLLEIDVVSYSGNGFGGFNVTTGKGMVFLYDFLPNKRYSLRLWQENGMYGLRVYTYESTEEVPTGNIKDSDPHFTEFVPFLNFQDQYNETLYLN